MDLEDYINAKTTEADEIARRKEQQRREQEQANRRKAEALYEEFKVWLRRFADRLGSKTFTAYRGQGFDSTQATFSAYPRDWWYRTETRSFSGGVGASGGYSDTTVNVSFKDKVTTTVVPIEKIDKPLFGKPRILESGYYLPDWDLSVPGGIFVAADAYASVAQVAQYATEMTFFELSRYLNNPRLRDEADNREYQERCASVREAMRNL